MSTPRSVMPVLRTLCGGYRLLLIVVAVVAVGAAALGFTLDRLAVPLEHSVWEHAGTPARWVLFGLGATITPTILPSYVAHGVTRRTFTLAAYLSGAALAALLALYLAAGFLAERAVFDAAGRSYEFAEGHLFTSAGQIHLVIAEYTLACAGYLVSGWLVGTAYYRHGVVRGTLALPLALLPAALVENVLGTGRWLGIGPPTLGLWEPDLPLAVALGLAATVLALALATLHRMTRTIPIRSRRP